LVILTTYLATKNTKLFDDVYVVTDSDLIFNEITSHGGKAIMSKKKYESGSNRIEEATQNIEADIIVNAQGDEPFTKEQSLTKLLNVFKNDKHCKIDLYQFNIQIPHINPLFYAHISS